MKNKKKVPAKTVDELSAEFHQIAVGIVTRMRAINAYQLEVQKMSQRLNEIEAEIKQQKESADVKNNPPKA
jgi:cell division protein ZapA (FtsZ GTPase activity inhibitor)